MSYKKAWRLVDSMNGIGSDLLVKRTIGGKGGGGKGNRWADADEADEPIAEAVVAKAVQAEGNDVHAKLLAMHQESLRQKQESDALAKKIEDVTQSFQGTLDSFRAALEGLNTKLDQTIGSFQNTTQEFTAKMSTIDTTLNTLTQMMQSIHESHEQDRNSVKARTTLQNEVAADLGGLKSHVSAVANRLPDEPPPGKKTLPQPADAIPQLAAASASGHASLDSTIQAQANATPAQGA